MGRCRGDGTRSPVPSAWYMKEVPSGKVRLLGGIADDLAGVLHVLEVGSPDVVDILLAGLPPALVHLDDTNVHVLTLHSVSVGQRHTGINIIEGDDIRCGHDHLTILVEHQVLVLEQHLVNCRPSSSICKCSHGVGLRSWSVSSNV